MNILLLDPHSSDIQWAGRFNLLTVGTEETDPNIVTKGRVRRLGSILRNTSFKPDLIIQREQEGNNFYIDMHQIKKPRIFLSANPHLTSYWAGKYASCFDAVITTQFNYVDYFRSHGIANVLWSPPSVHTQRIETIEQREKELDVSFIGNFDRHFHIKRKSFLDKLKKILESKGARVYFGTGNWSDVYSKSKIVINDTVNGEVNSRIFEAALCGAMVLTPDIGNGLDRLFRQDDLILYEDNNISDAYEKIDFYLKNSEKRQIVANNGQNHVKTNHIFMRNRAVKLEEFVEQISEMREIKPTNDKIRSDLADSLYKLAMRPLPANPSNEQVEEMLYTRLRGVAELLNSNKNLSQSETETLNVCSMMLKNSYAEVS